MESSLTKLPEDVTSLLQDEKALLFIIDGCPYCAAAMTILKAKGV